MDRLLPGRVIGSRAEPQSLRPTALAFSRSLLLDDRLGEKRISRRSRRDAENAVGYGGGAGPGEGRRAGCGDPRESKVVRCPVPDGAGGYPRRVGGTPDQDNANVHRALCGARVACSTRRRRQTPLCGSTYSAPLRDELFIGRRPSHEAGQREHGGPETPGEPNVGSKGTPRGGSIRVDTRPVAAMATAGPLSG